MDSVSASKRKEFDRPTTLLKGSVGFFFSVHMYDEFHVPDVLIVLLWYVKTVNIKLSVVLIETKAIF